MYLMHALHTKTNLKKLKSVTLKPGRPGNPGGPRGPGSPGRPSWPGRPLVPLQPGYPMGPLSPSAPGSPCQMTMHSNEELLFISALYQLYLQPCEAQQCATAQKTPCTSHSCKCHSGLRGGDMNPNASHVHMHKVLIDIRPVVWVV